MYFFQQNPSGCNFLYFLKYTETANSLCKINTLPLATLASVFYHSTMGAMGWLASIKGHTLDLEVTFSCQVIDGLQVEAVGELERVSIWQLDGQVGLVEGDAHLCNTSRLEGEGSLSLLSPPGPAILAVTHNGVDISMYIEARVEVQAHIVVIFAQVQREALGVGGYLAPHSEALPRFEIQVAGDQITSHD